MNSDDLTQPMTNDEAKDTQPTITAVFRLLREVKQDVENLGAGLHTINNRLDAIDMRLGANDRQFEAIDRRFEAIDRRFDAIDSRFDELELRLTRDIEGVNVRVIQGFKEFSTKIDILNRSRLQTEADYHGLDQRVTELESKPT